MQTNFYENNGGMIYAIVFDGGKIVNIIPGLEDQQLSSQEVIELAGKGFPFADEFEPDQWNGYTMQQILEEAENGESDGTVELIAEITADKVSLYPEKMGCSAKELFEVED